jgi:hypothetical protein
MSRSYVSVSAGVIHWGGIREMASRLGLHVEESRGILTRHFTLRGDEDALRVAKAHIDEFITKYEAKRA